MKYEVTNEIIESAGRKLHRIRALVDIITLYGRPVKKVNVEAGLKKNVTLVKMETLGYTIMHEYVVLHKFLIMHV